MINEYVLIAAYSNEKVNIYMVIIKLPLYTNPLTAQALAMNDDDISDSS